MIYKTYETIDITIFKIILFVKYCCPVEAPENTND